MSRSVIFNTKIKLVHKQDKIINVAKLSAYGHHTFVTMYN